MPNQTAIFKPALLLGLLLLAASRASPAWSAEKTYKGYCLEQKSNHFGEYRVIACPDAVRIDGTTGGFTCVSKAPEWNVIIYRLDTRVYANLDYRRWCMLNCITLNSDQFVSSKPLSITHGQEKGQKTVTYYFNSKEYTGNFGIFQSEKKHSEILQRARVKCMDWPDDIHPSAVTGKLFGLPPLKGIPMEISIAPVGSSSFSEIELACLKIVKNDAIPASKFVVPPGLRPVTINDRIFMNERTNDVIKEIISVPTGE